MKQDMLSAQPAVGGALDPVRALLGAETAEQQRQKPALRRPHTAETPRIMSQVARRALTITLLVNWLHELRGSPVRHATRKWGETQVAWRRGQLESQLTGSAPAPGPEPGAGPV